jgi:hypothetical protein
MRTGDTRCGWTAASCFCEQLVGALVPQWLAERKVGMYRSVLRARYCRQARTEVAEGTVNIQRSIRNRRSNRPSRVVREQTGLANGLRCRNINLLGWAVGRQDD